MITCLSRLEILLLRNTKLNKSVANRIDWRKIAASAIGIMSAIALGMFLHNFFEHLSIGPERPKAIMYSSDDWKVVAVCDRYYLAFRTKGEIVIDKWFGWSKTRGKDRFVSKSGAILIDIYSMPAAANTELSFSKYVHGQQGVRHDSSVKRLVRGRLLELSDGKTFVCKAARGEKFWTVAVSAGTFADFEIFAR